MEKPVLRLVTPCRFTRLEIFGDAVLGRMPTMHPSEDPCQRVEIRGDILLSRVHCAFGHDEGVGWRLADLGSLNGTFLNGDRLQSREPVTLIQGDEIRLGRHTFEVELS